MSRINIRTRYWPGLLVIGAIAALMTLVLPALTADGADHLDAPLVQADGRTDINDVFAFSNGSNTVLVMTVNPLAGVLSPTGLKPGTDYEFAIDNDGDAEEDIVYRVQASRGSSQKVTLRRAGDGNGGDDDHGHRRDESDDDGDDDDGNRRDDGDHDGDDDRDDDDRRNIAKGKAEKIISVRGGGSLYVGLRDDPFFFDLVAFQNGLAFCPGGVGSDFFAGLNVTAIVLEVPTSSLLDGTPNIGVWGRIIEDDEQIERMGRPIINTALIPAGSKDAFNATEPEDDVADWLAAVQASLLALNGDAAYSAVVAGILLPDILTYDTSAAASYLNGRGLADDVGDLTLGVVSNGAITTDCVNANDVAFSGSFPFLANPN